MEASDQVVETTLMPKQEIAAQALAAGKTNGEAALIAEVGENTIYTWKRKPYFQRAVERFQREREEALLTSGLALRPNRIAELVELFDAQRAIRQGRAADPVMQSVPGGESGLMNVTEKTVGYASQGRVVLEATFDRALSQEMRATLQHIAQELGQWQDRSEITQIDGPAFTLDADSFSGPMVLPPANGDRQPPSEGQQTAKNGPLSDERPANGLT